MLYMSNNDLINKLILDLSTEVLEYEVDERDIKEFIEEFVSEYFYIQIDDNSDSIVISIHWYLLVGQESHGSI